MTAVEQYADGVRIIRLASTAKRNALNSVTAQAPLYAALLPPVLMVDLERMVYR